MIRIRHCDDCKTAHCLQEPGDESDIPVQGPAFRCRICDSQERLDVPNWHPARRYGPRPRTLTLRVWRGNLLRVAQVDDRICSACCERFRKPMQGAKTYHNHNRPTTKENGPCPETQQSNAKIHPSS